MRLPLAISLVLVACGGSSPPSETPPAKSTATTASTVPPEAPPSKSLKRSDVNRVVRQGLGAFLQRVDLDEEPVLEAGKFKGFRIRGLRGEGWKGVDLQPGDVVMKVNGFSIERPDTALEAFRSLEVASELRVDIERQGAPRAVRYTIVDDTDSGQQKAR